MLIPGSGYWREKNHGHSICYFVIDFTILNSLAILGLAKEERERSRGMARKASGRRDNRGSSTQMT
jgi:hypothetical protein